VGLSASQYAPTLDLSSLGSASNSPLLPVLLYDSGLRNVTGFLMSVCPAPLGTGRTTSTLLLQDPRRCLENTDGLPRSQGKPPFLLSAFLPLSRGSIRTCVTVRENSPEVVDSSSRRKRSFPASPPSQ
jgi:hypothetical protein